MSWARLPPFGLRHCAPARGLPFLLGPAQVTHLAPFSFSKISENTTTSKKFIKYCAFIQKL